MKPEAAALRPRLLVLASTYPRWGGDTEPGFVHELARRLTDHFDVTVLCPHAPGAAERETLDGVDVHRYRYAPARLETLVNEGGIVANLKQRPWKWLLVPSFLAGLFWSYWRLLRCQRPQVVHAHWLLPQGAVAACARRLSTKAPPFVVTSHGADLFALRQAPLQAVKRFVIRHAHRVTVVSSAMTQTLEQLGAPMARVEVQPMGADLSERFRLDASTVRSPNELLYVGRLVEKKGVHHLLAAMPAIVRQRPGTRLTVVGGGPDQDKLRRQAADLGVTSCVEFLGPLPQSELPALYRRAAVFVAPFVRAASGDEEGLGLVSIEAAGCGCRLVLGDVPAVRSVFEGLPSVYLTAPQDTAALAAACVTALSEGAAESGLVAALRARFDWSVRAQAYAGVLDAAAKSEHGAQ